MGLFIANEVLELKTERATPAVCMADGHDYVKTNKYVLFGHHFAAIAAAGPLLGPVLTVMPTGEEGPESKDPKLCSAGEIRF